MPEIPAIGRRTAAIAASALLGLAGAAILVTYVRSLESRSLRGAEPVEVLVANQTIPAGTSVEVASERGLVVPRAVPRVALVDGAVTSIDAIKGRAAVSDVLKGEQLTEGRFTESAAKRGLLPIPPDRQAVAAEVEVPPGAGGFVQPGDHVSVIARTSSGANGDGRVQYLLQDVAVLSVGEQVVAPGREARPSEDEPQQQSRVLLTLALTPQEAEKLVFAMLDGRVWFTLLPPGQGPVATGGRTIANLFS